MVKTISILGHPHAYELTASTCSSTTLVFVHGWLLSREYWQPVVQALAADYSCLSYDLRGFGDSQGVAGGNCDIGRNGSTPDHSHAAKATSSPDQNHATEPIEVVTASFAAETTPAAAGFPYSSAAASIAVASKTVMRYTPAAYAQDLGALLRELNITNAWLVGHSLGGSIALWAAEQLPDVIRGVVCINSGGGIYLKEEFDRFRAVGQQLVKLRPRWLCYIPWLELPMCRMNVARPLARAWGRQRLLDMVAANPEAALGTLLESTTEAEVHRLPQVVSRLQQPVYFIAGANDDIMEPKYVRHLASFHSLFQDCGHNVFEVPNCGHLAMVEQPTAIANYIRSFLANHHDG